MIETGKIPSQDWVDLKLRVVQGGKNIIDHRGRSSFQSPSYLSIMMIAAAMGGKPFVWPAGTYVNNNKFDHIMMAMETVIDKSGVHYNMPKGNTLEENDLDTSYIHLRKLRDEVIGMGIIPPIDKWGTVNPHM